MNKLNRKFVISALSDKNKMVIPTSPVATPIHFIFVNVDLKMIAPMIMVSIGVVEFKNPASALLMRVSAMQNK